MYKIIQKRKIWLSISSTLVVLSIIALAIWGLDFGIDFTGGSLLEIKFNGERPSVQEVQDLTSDLEVSSLTVQPVGENEMILRFQDTDEEIHHEILEVLASYEKEDEASTTVDQVDQAADVQVESEGGDLTIEGIEIANDTTSTAYVEELKFDSVGPSIGAELKRKSIYASIAVLIAIVLYIAWTFRKVSKPVASWKYGLTAIIALFHDVFIVLGAFAILGYFYSVEINTPFVAAILTVLGYSVNDTIVVFDRIRENLPKSDDDFEGTVNTSVNQTLTRSLYTSFTTLLVLLSIFFFGGSSIRDFVLALSFGVFIGTYSSIFLASPLLVVWEKLKK